MPLIVIRRTDDAGGLFTFSNFRGSFNQQEAETGKCFNQQSDAEQTKTNTVYSILVLNLWLENSCWIVWINQQHACSQDRKIRLFISRYQLIWITCVNIFLFFEYLFIAVSGLYRCSWISALICFCRDHKGNIMHALSIR